MWHVVPGAMTSRSHGGDIRIVELAAAACKAHISAELGSPLHSVASTAPPKRDMFMWLRLNQARHGVRRVGVQGVLTVWSGAHQVVTIPIIRLGMF